MVVVSSSDDEAIPEVLGSMGNLRRRGRKNPASRVEPDVPKRRDTRVTSPGERRNGEQNGDKLIAGRFTGGVGGDGRLNE